MHSSVTSFGEQIMTMFQLHSNITKHLYANDLDFHNTLQSRQTGSSCPHFTLKKFEDQRRQGICPVSCHRCKHSPACIWVPPVTLENLLEDLPGSGFLAKLEVLTNAVNSGYANAPGCVLLLTLDSLPAQCQHQHHQHL